MQDKLRTAVVWLTLAQVTLVGALGTGLHSLLGCEHGRSGCCGQDGCVASRCCSSEGGAPACDDCAFCEHRQASRDDSTPTEPVDGVSSADGAACCDGCAVCDLLAQYSTAHLFTLDPPTIEPIAGAATLQLHNAVVSAATRLPLSRGPPAA